MPDMSRVKTTGCSGKETSNVRRNPLMVRILSAAIGAALVLAASSAGARTENLRWYHDDPGLVSGYKVHWGPSQGSYTTTINVGKPTPDGDGVVSYTISVPDEQTVHVAVTAFDGDGDSPFSNEKVYQGDAPPPPDPPDPPGGGGGGSDGSADSAIDGFRLWNAGNDTVIDNDFRDGDVIALASAGSCTAIEILGNGYLQTLSLPGSVLVSFDGDSPGVCNNLVAPYAWETYDGPGNFGCADSLLEPGDHILSVRPFDGDNCTGPEGPANSVSFEVIAAPPASGEPLGPPGKPVLVY